MPLFIGDHIMKYTYCIWDFNGTILDDVELGIYTINVLLEKNGIDKQVDRRSYREIFDFPVIDYYRVLGFDFDKTPYTELAEDWVELYLGNLDKATLFDDVIDTLEFFKKNRISQSILSASEKKMLDSQTAELNIRDYFEEIMGIDNIYADSKLALARAFRERHPEERALFIGDTTHDIETAKTLSADCFIVCAGHQCRERFEGSGAKVFDSLSELCEYLKKEELI